MCKLCEAIENVNDHITKTKEMVEGNKKDFPKTASYVERLANAMYEGMKQAGQLREEHSRTSITTSIEWSLHFFMKELADEGLVEFTEEPQESDEDSKPEPSNAGPGGGNGGSPVPMPGAAALTPKKEEMQEACLCRH